MVQLIVGHLDIYQGQETEGPVYGLYDRTFTESRGLKTLDGFTPLKKGDLLTVFTDESRKEIVYEGEVAFARMAVASGGTEKPVDIDDKAWRKMVFQSLPAQAIRKP